MTICIAEIADLQNPTTSPKIVFCADRMISAGLQFEHGVPKIQALTTYCYAMMSSDDSLTSDMIVKGVQARIVGQQPTVARIAELFSEVAKQFKQAKRQEEILAPLGLTYESYANSNTMSRDLANTVANLLLGWQYGFRCDFLIFGLDLSPSIGAHVYQVNQDGDVKLQDFLGFGVIGSGSHTAFPELTKLVWHQGITMIDAIVRVFNAKKAAERMGGVGQFTDLYVLHVSAPGKQPVVAYLWRIPEDLIRLLQDAHTKMKSTELSAYQEMGRAIFEKIQESLAKEQARASNSGTASANATATVDGGATQT